MAKINLIVLMCLFSISFIACKNKKAAPAENEANLTKSEIEFNQFYDDFHADSLYQVQHIEFPLAGKTSLGQDTFWEAETWKIHKRFNLKNVKNNLQLFDKTAIEHLVIDNMYLIERQFSKSPKDGQWRLIYYTEPIDGSANKPE